MSDLEKESQEQSSLPRIGVESREWLPGLDITPPIAGEDIPGFKAWVGWNGYGMNHKGLDFAAYLNDKDELVIGLPPETPVRAVADGEIIQTGDYLGRYATFINIAHGNPSDNIYSCYHHVSSEKRETRMVRKGEIIGHLYKDKGEDEGRLVHLHFSLTNAWDISNRYEIDPLKVFDQLQMIQTRSPKSINPELIDREQPKNIRIAHFKKLLVPDLRE